MKRILLCTLISALLAGCGGESHGNDLEELDENTSLETGSEANGAVTSAIQRTVLEGTWQKQCGPVEGAAHYDFVTVSFSYGKFSTHIKNYNNSHCTDLFNEATSSGNFALGGDVLLSDGATATELIFNTIEYNGAHFDDKEYNIVYIDKDTFYAGSDSFDSPTQWPTSLDYSSPFYRVK